MQALEKNCQNKFDSCEKFDLKKIVIEIGDIHEKDINPPWQVSALALIW